MPANTHEKAKQALIAGLGKDGYHECYVAGKREYQIPFGDAQLIKSNADLRYDEARRVVGFVPPTWIDFAWVDVYNTSFRGFPNLNWFVQFLKDNLTVLALTRANFDKEQGEDDEYVPKKVYRVKEIGGDQSYLLFDLFGHFNVPIAVKFFLFDLPRGQLYDCAICNLNRYGLEEFAVEFYWEKSEKDGTAPE